jgi:hypothetical protein
VARLYHIATGGACRSRVKSGRAANGGRLRRLTLSGILAAFSARYQRRILKVSNDLSNKHRGCGSLSLRGRHTGDDFVSIAEQQDRFPIGKRHPVMAVIGREMPHATPHAVDP